MKVPKFGRLIGFAVLLILPLLIADVTEASGSWGSRRGIAGGSWGGGSRGGILSGRAPVRNLLGRTAMAVGRVGSTGVNLIQNRPRLIGRLANRLGGRLGGSGGFGCTGGGYVSTGGSVGSYGGSVGSIVGSTSGSNYGSWGSSYISTAGLSAPVSTYGSSYVSAPVATAPIASSYETSFGYVEPGISTGYDMGFAADTNVVGTGTMMSSDMMMGAPIVDGPIVDGHMGMPIESGMPMDSGMILDGGMPMQVGNPSLIEGAMPADPVLTEMPMDGGSINGGPILGGSSVIEDGSVPIYDSNDPPNDSGGGNAPIFDGNSFPGSEQPPMPQPSEDQEDTRYKPRSNGAAVLALQVPEEAKVFINDRLTTTQGNLRSYVSRRIKEGKPSVYRIKAVVQRDGREVVRTKTVRLNRGARKTVAMNFDQAAVTTLALKVPADAKVELAGNETDLRGRTRYFSTRSLKDGQAWKGYSIRVSVVRNGETVTREKTIDLASGETRMVKFDFVSDQIVAR